MAVIETRRSGTGPGAWIVISHGSRGSRVFVVLVIVLDGAIESRVFVQFTVSQPFCSTWGGWRSHEAGCRNWDGVIGLGLPSRAVVANVRVCESWDGKLIGSSASKLS